LPQKISVCLLAVAFALAAAPSAGAEGGSSIATAPSVVFGQQEFGNTANQPAPAGYCIDRMSYWSMAVTVGDTITINWESHSATTRLDLLPVGTTDFNVGKASPVASQTPAANHKNELTYAANRSGTVAVRFTDNSECQGSLGPFSYTASVAHALNLALPRIAALRSRGVLTVGVHNPEGGTVNDPAVQVVVQIKARGSWQMIGTAAVSNSAALVHYTIPARLRHQRVTLRALAHGTGYQSADSAHAKVRTL
jgi:hypothetical protein